MDPIQVRVIADTNILRTNDDRYLFSVVASELAKKQTGLHKRVFIAEITAKEIIYQKTRSTQNLRGNLESAVKMLTSFKDTLPVPVGWRRSISSCVTRLRERVDSGYGWSDPQKAISQGVKAELRKLGITLLKTPTRKINWTQMIDDAVWRRAPFEGSPESKSEKGFRDALFAETAITAVLSEPAAHWCILTNDGKLVERLNVEIRNRSLGRLQIYQTIEDFHGFTKMLAGKYHAAIATKLPILAGRLFFDYRAPNAGLWVTAEIGKKISVAYGEKLAEPRTVPAPQPTSYSGIMSVPTSGLGFDYTMQPGVISTSNSPFSVLSTGPSRPSIYNPFETRLTWTKSSDDKYYLESTRFVERMGADRVRWASRIRIFALYSRPIVFQTTLSSDQPDKLIREVSIDVI